MNPYTNLESPWACGARELDWRGRPYTSSVPPHINDLPSPVDDTQFDLTADTILLARTDTARHARTLRRIEAVASSRIEGIRARAADILAAGAGARADEAAALVVDANARTIDQALATAAVTPAAIIDIQTVLLERSAPRHTGGFRTTTVWIGRPWSSPATAVFVPPSPGLVPDLIDDLTAFTTRTDMHPLVHAAIAHAQFETIHPFSDGNGRTGRALYASMLHRAGLATGIPTSVWLAANHGTYIDALVASRQGDLTQIVTVMTEATRAGAHIAADVATALDEERARWEMRVTARRDAAVWRALDIVMRDGAVTVGSLAAELGVSEPAASRAVDQMRDAHILLPWNDHRRNRTFYAPGVAHVVDEWACVY